MRAPSTRSFQELERFGLAHLLLGWVYVPAVQGGAEVSTGADLEMAIAAAAKHYRAVDRCELAKQHTPRRFNNQHTAKAPVDFKGWSRDDRIGHDGGRNPLYVEAKATSDGLISFVAKDGDGIKENQLNAMRDAVARNIHMLLVVDFVREQEVYVVDVRHIVDFAAAPWRKSLPFMWFRAMGELAKVSVERQQRRVWFLDTRPHDLQAGAYLAVVADKARHEGVVVDLFPAEITPSKKLHARLSARPAPGTPEYADYIKGLANEGMTRVMRGRRKPSYGRKRGWGGR